MSNTTPKALMPLWGKPVMEHVLELLGEWGVRDILINLHHAPGQMIEALKHRGPGPRLQFSFEPEILGTGGGLVRARWFFGDEPFWVVNTDIAADLKPQGLIAALGERSTVAALWMHPDKGPRTVELEDDGCVRTFRSATPAAAGTFTFCGVQIVSPALFPFLKGERFHSIVEGYEAAMQAGYRVRGVVAPHSFWADLGTPADYLAAHRDILRAARAHEPGRRLMNDDMPRRLRRIRAMGGEIKGFAAVGADVRVATGARVEDAVLWDGVHLGRHAAVKASIIGGNVRLNSACYGPAVPANVYNAGAGFRALLEELGFAPGRTVVCPLPTRGSNRSFARLASGRRTAMLIRYNDVRRENARFAGHARFLRAQGVPVPRVLADRPRERMAVVEDVGSRSLEEVATQVSMRQLERHYRRVLEAVVTLHHIPLRRLKAARVGLEPAFSATVYAWERALMAKYFLKRWLRLPEARIAAILDELAGVAKRLVKAPPVLVHRDLQSSNILLRRGKVVLIDFQGMRAGPAAYDLASLLCDPYVMLPAPVQERLRDAYLARCDQRKEVRAVFELAAVQRLCQALGAYGRLAVIPGTQRFGAYIPRGLAMLSRMLQQVDGLPALAQVCAENGGYSRTT